MVRWQSLRSGRHLSKTFCSRDEASRAKILAARRETSISGAAFISEAFIAAIERGCMTVKTFVDTNILVYAHDIDDRAKRAAAREVLLELWNDGTGVVSPQVLQEFYVCVTRKIVVPISKEAARQIVGAYAAWCTDITSSDVAAAFRIEDEARIGF